MIRPSLREMVKLHEGLRLFPYLCPAGKKSIGYGWNLEANRPPEHIAAYLRMNGRITEEMAEELLTISLGAAIEDARSLYPGFDGFTEDRQDALVDFVFNVGAGKAVCFKRMRQAINDGNWPWAADELKNSRYYLQVGNRGRELEEMLRHG